MLMQVSLQVADALDQPFPDGMFDLVWSMESGEHMPDKTKVTYFTPSYKIRKKGISIQNILRKEGISIQNIFTYGTFYIFTDAGRQRTATINIYSGDFLKEIATVN